MTVTTISPLYNNLLSEVEQLSSPELEQFVNYVLGLQARRRAPSLPQREAELLLKINQGWSIATQARYEALIAKRQAEQLNASEYDELLALTEQAETLNVRRIEALVELARYRQTSLPRLMATLGLQEPGVV